MKSGSKARNATLALATALLIASAATSSRGAAVNSDTEGNCFKTLSRSISKHAAAITKAKASCLARLYEGDTVSCPDADMDHAIAKSEASIARSIAKRCQSSCSGPTALSCIADTTCPPNGALPELCSGDGDFQFGTMGFPGPLCPSILGHDMLEPEDFGACMTAPGVGVGEVIADDVLTNLFGTLDGTPALTATATGCLESLEKSVPKTISKLAGTVSKCRIKQLTADNAEFLVNKCPTADAKTADGTAKSITRLRDGIDEDCNDTDIAELDLCGGGVTTVAAAQDCLEQLVREAGYSIDPPASRPFSQISVVNGAYPGSALAACGDDVVNQIPNQFALNGEECDGTDDSACPGLCLPPGDIFECTCSNVRRSHGYADGFAADLDNGWSGKSHNSKVTDLAGFVSDVSGCDCDQFDPIDQATCETGHSTDPVCNLASEVFPRCERRMGDHTSCDQVGDGNGDHTDVDCQFCDQFTVNAGDFCTGHMRRCIDGTNDGDRCNSDTDCPLGACSGAGICLDGGSAGTGCNADSDCGGNDCVQTTCINGDNDDAACASNADCTGGGRCANTTDCTAQCYPEGSTDPGDATTTCAKQSDCAEGFRCRGICDITDECVTIRNGAPLPLSSNGTSVCIDSQFFTNITGTRDIITGEHAINYELRSVIVLAGGHELNSRPCPVCGGFCDGPLTPATGQQPQSFLCDGTCATDPALECRFGQNIGDPCTSNADCLGELCTGKRCRFDDDCASGVCSGADSPECTTHGTGDCVLELQCGGGTKPNQACRIEAYTSFGTTSSDCPMSGAILSGLAISWTPLTSEAVSNEEPGACDATGFQNYDCNCVRGGGGTRNQPAGCDPACTDPNPAYFGKSCAFFTKCVDACVLGSNAGGDCTSNADCPGGTCPGGIHRGGSACDEDSDCDSGNCSGNPRVCGNGSTGQCSVRRCTGGTNPGVICTQPAACFGPGASCPTAEPCTIGTPSCAEGSCKPASCVTAATCTGGATCDDVCPAGVCTPLCVPSGICNGGDRNGQRCGIDEKCIGGGTCVAGDPEEGACAQGNFYHCDGPGWEFLSCTAGNVNTQNGCAAGLEDGPGDDNPGAGFCRADILNCFINNGAAEGGDTLNGKGDPTNTLSVATFCIPASGDPAVNSTAGLPGPGRIRQPGYTTNNFDVLP